MSDHAAAPNISHNAPAETAACANPDCAPSLPTLQDVAAHLPLGVVLLAMPDGRLLLRNEATVRLLGWDDEEPDASSAAARILAGLLRGDRRAYASNAHPLHRAMQESAATREEVARKHNDGTITWLVATFAPMRDAEGRVTTLLCTFKDITAHRATEDALGWRNVEVEDAFETLRMSHEELLNMGEVVEMERQRYRSLFDFVPDGYAVTDWQGILQEANYVLAAKLGLKPQYVKGKVLSTFVANEDRVRFRTCLARLRPEQGPQEWEVRFTPRKGEAFDAHVTVTPIYDRRGVTTGLHWIIQDITTRKQLEKGRATIQESLLEQERHAAMLEERNRIAQEFHDTLAQGFTGISFLLASAGMAVTKSPDEAQQLIARAAGGDGKHRCRPPRHPRHARRNAGKGRASRCACRPCGAYPRRYRRHGGIAGAGNRCQPARANRG